MKYLIVFLVFVFGLNTVALAQTKTAPTSVSPDILKLFERGNDEKVEINEAPLVLGDAEAPITAVLFYAINCTDSASFFTRVLPAIKSSYVDTKKLRLVLYEYPLNWRDMQYMAALRCVPQAKHFDALAYSSNERNYIASRMRNLALDDVHKFAVPALEKFGLTEAEIKRCMTNSQALGYVDGLRRLAEDQFGVSTTPELLIGGKKFVVSQIDNLSKFDDIMKNLSK